MHDDCRSLTVITGSICKLPITCIHVFECLLIIGHIYSHMAFMRLQMLIYGGIFGCLSPILSVSAFLSYKSPFVYPKDEVIVQ